MVLILQNALIIFLGHFYFGSGALAGQSACTSDFEQGKCVCKLLDGRGTLDLTPYVEKTKIQPLHGTDPTAVFSYYFSFCSVQKNRDDLKGCYNKASVCQYAGWQPDFDQVDGEPSTTTFEMRTTERSATPRLALVTYSRRDSGGVRSVAFLKCDPDAETPIFIPDLYFADKDIEDGFLLYYSEVRGKLFCLTGTSGATAITTPTALFVISATFFARFG